MWRKRTRIANAKVELEQSQASLKKAQRELQRRRDQHLDTIERRERMHRILEENHIADLMYEALAEKRGQ